MRDRFFDAKSTETNVSGTLPYTGGTPVATYTNVVSECQDATVDAETAALAANQAAAKGNYGLIDGYREFMEQTDWESLVNADGVHPTDAGQLVWAEAAKKFLPAL